MADLGPAGPKSDFLRIGVTAAIFSCNHTEPGASDALSDIRQAFFKQSNKRTLAWSGIALPLKVLVLFY